MAAGSDIPSKVTLLELPAARGHLEIVEQILEACPDIVNEPPGASAVEAAMTAGHAEVVDRPLEAGAHWDGHGDPRKTMIKTAGNLTLAHSKALGPQRSHEYKEKEQSD